MRTVIFYSTSRFAYIRASYSAKRTVESQGAIQGTGGFQQKRKDCLIHYFLECFPVPGLLACHIPALNEGVAQHKFLPA